MRLLARRSAFKGEGESGRIEKQRERRRRSRSLMSEGFEKYERVGGIVKNLSGEEVLLQMSTVA